MKYEILLAGKSKYLEIIFSNLFHKHRVYYSYNPVNCLSILESNPIDILILQFKDSSSSFIQEVFSKYPNVSVFLILEKGQIKQVISEMEDILFEYIETPCEWEDIEQRLKVVFEISRLKKIYYRFNIFNIMTPHIEDALKKGNIDNLYKVIVDYLENAYKNMITLICDIKEDNQFIIKEISEKGTYILDRMGFKKGSVIEVPLQELNLLLENKKMFIENLSIGPLNELRKEGFKKSLIFPLLFGSKIKGLFISVFLDEEDVEQEDIKLFKQLTSKLSFIIDHVNLIKETNKLSQDLRQSQDIIMHQQRLKVLGQMASGISHDLNNIVFPIIGFTELLLEREAGISKQGRKYLYQILGAAEDIKNIVERLRQFYKKREEIESELEWVDLNEIVKEVVELTEAKWKKGAIEKGIKIEVDCVLLPKLKKIKGVKSEIREALINLIFNAVDALVKGGKIIITTKMDKDVIKLSVKDNGIGIDKETLEHCFEPFFTTKGEKGTGLGLSIVYGIMNRHGGKVEIKSELGKGTEVILIFPCVLEEEKKAQKEKKERTSLKPLKILYIDDEIPVTSLVKDILSADGHTVVVANDGESGVRLFNENMRSSKPFDLVITDYVMPKMDGGKVASAIKSLSPETPIILLTGWDLPKSQMKGNVELFLKKPVFPSELRSAISKLIAKKK